MKLDVFGRKKFAEKEEIVLNQCIQRLTKCTAMAVEISPLDEANQRWNSYRLVCISLSIVKETHYRNNHAAIMRCLIFLFIFYFSKGLSLDQ